MAIVYVLTNPAFENYVKVGKTTNLEQRLRRLDNTSTPLPFRCEYAVEVQDDVKVEKLVHEAFADHRIRKNREFFEVDPQRVISALKLAGGTEVTPKEDIAKDQEGVKALKKAIHKKQRRSNSKFSDVDLKVGDIIHYVKDSQVTAEIIGENKILFEDKETSLSTSASTLMQRDGYKFDVNGWGYWMFEGETLAERFRRMREDAIEEEEIDK